MGYIYLVIEVDAFGNERYKIGFTKNNPEKRVKSLQTGNSNNISLLKTFKTKNYKLLEKWLHTKFYNQKTEANNEWFQLTNEEINNFTITCKEYDEIINSYNEKVNLI